MNALKIDFSFLHVDIYKMAILKKSCAVLIDALIYGWRVLNNA